jgi:uncharacterized membrane protein YeaQ/YmgE (transglycosylase-associated protein family)
MDILLWVLTGGLIGWIAFSRFGFNEQRGLNVSILLGAAGALFGVKMVAPMFLTLPAGELGVAAIVFAAAAACAVLVLGNLVSNRWGI